MVRQASLFSQLLHPVPRGEFDQRVRHHAAEKGAKGFTSWTQLVAMRLCPLGRADSLREICHGRACCVGNTSGWDGRPSARRCPTPNALRIQLWTALIALRLLKWLHDQSHLS